MRNLLFLICIVFTQFVHGQELTSTRTATLMDGDYTLDGTVYLEMYDDNTLDLRFDSDYMTQSNVFDVHVFLSTHDNFEAPIDTAGMLLVENIGTINGLNYSSGPMTFNLPEGVNIEDYDHIVLICVQFGQLHWGDGIFGASVPATTSTHSINQENNMNIYPNPSSDGTLNIQFQNIIKAAQIEVINLNGQIISSETINEQNHHIIELREAGVYFIRLTTSEGTLSKKVIRL